MAIVYADDKLVRGSEVRELYEDAGWSLLSGRSADEIEDAIRHTPVFITARDGAKLVGMVGAITDHSYYAHVTELLVLIRYRDTGVRAELLRRLLDALPAARSVSLFGEPDQESFYRRFDFAPTGGGMQLQRKG